MGSVENVEGLDASCEELVLWPTIQCHICLKLVLEQSGRITSLLPYRSVSFDSQLISIMAVDSLLIQGISPMY